MEKSHLKKEIRQAVKLFFLVVNLIFAGSLVQSQTLTPTNNKGGYTFEKISDDDGKAIKTKIYGKAVNLKDSTSISEAKIKFACTTITTNKEGEFEFTVKNNDLKTNFLKIIALGFKTVETENFQVKPRTRLNVNFYLEEDDRPFIDCGSVN